MRPFGTTLAVSVVLTLCLISVAAGCAPQPADGGFAIYLTRNNVPPSQMEMLSHVDLAEEPIIAMGDIVSYDASTHEITLTPKAFQRIAQLQVPTTGTSFVVCVDRSLVYWGAFWVLHSSLSFDGVTIWLPLILDEQPVVQIRMGYPGPMPNVHEDPRNAPEILAAFQTAGKLIVRPPTLRMDELPRSMKGYELYSWQEDDEWHFTLITGTNRNKTVDEVLSREPLVTTEGWVHIHVIGIDELKATLNRVPEGEHIMWFERFHGQGGESITLPPQNIVEAVARHAETRGLDLVVPLSG